MFNNSIINIYNYFLSFIFQEDKPKFEKPRAYKNISSHETIILKS